MISANAQTTYLKWLHAELCEMAAGSKDMDERFYGLQYGWSYPLHGDAARQAHTLGIKKYTQDIGAAVSFIEDVLPDFWWSCGKCQVSNDADVFLPGARAHGAPDYQKGERAQRLLYHPEMGRQFDEGFSIDLLGGNVAIALLIVAVEALLALIQAGETVDIIV